MNAKVDTGARSSSLHAFDVQPFQRDGVEWVRFNVSPLQRKRVPIVTASAPLLDMRSVRSSNGKATLRPVILTTVTLLDATWDVELTLANRDQMGFRMLLGRQAIRNRFLVNSARSYFGGRRPPKAPQPN